MSFYTTFKTFEDVLNFLTRCDNPTCFKVNYLPNTDEYDLWIGNQPYESYEEIIEDIYNQLNKSREKNNKLMKQNEYLESLLNSYKKENETLKTRLYFEEGYSEKLKEEFFKEVKRVNDKYKLGITDEEMKELYFYCGGK